MNIPAIVIIIAFLLAVLILFGSEIYWTIRNAREARREAKKDLQEIVRTFSKVE